MHDEYTHMFGEKFIRLDEEKQRECVCVFLSLSIPIDDITKLRMKRKSGQQSRTTTTEWRMNEKKCTLRVEREKLTVDGIKSFSTC